ncbi:GNAT family N-acetyltransferase [Paludibacter sp. 221]|uniref:GNAT family N-acetyltransferase n=1 Tax=Paludibacter sp. 221 TaxID=2302939 RepID=UPI0013D25F19|nr:GNAT family N-acetyltransferase [Paludibacter sp. 221]NDV46923.1 GNAT family N-acetyltransferase [Paludibacter sp. 221]
MEHFITLNKDNLDKEHICCAFSDKKCKESYELKKEWLRKEFDNGYIFRRIDARAKVFIEYVPAEKGWVPVVAPDYLLINCFWVSGQYKSQGYGKALLQAALDDAEKMGKNGLVTVAGTSKFHFMSDTKWLQRQGFEICETLPYGFSLLVKKIKKDAENPKFNKSVVSGECENKTGITVYYSNRCPFSEFHVRNSLVETAEKRNIPLTVIKLETLEDALNAPSPATIFSLFYNGKFVTTDLSVCMDSRFDKVMGKVLSANSF